MKPLAALLVAFTAALSHATDFPSKPVHIVVPNPPGGTVELVARAVATGLGPSLGQPIVIDVKTGGNSIIGTEMVARSAPDGYTLLLGGTHVTINPLLRKLPYDGLDAFAPVALLAATPNVIAVNAALPVRNIAELIALAKARPGQLNCASSPIGNGIQLAAERFRSQAGIEWNFVPFQGGVQAALAVAAGHADVMVAPLSDAAPHLASGRVRILAITSPQRIAMFPEVPTLAESGFPGFQALQWFGALAPAGTPKPVIARLSADMRRALDNPEIRASFEKVGLVVMPLGPEQFDEFLRTEMRGFAAVIRDNHIKVD